MGALAPQRKEWSLQMRTQYIGAPRRLARDDGEVGAHHVERIGNEGQHLPRSSMVHMPGTRHSDGVGPIIEGTFPSAMGVNIHITGRQPCPLSIDHADMIRTAHHLNVRGEIIIEGA